MPDCPGDSAREKERIRYRLPRRFRPREGGDKGFSFPVIIPAGTLTPTLTEGLNIPGDTARGKEKMRGLDFPSDFARGKEKIVVSTCPGTQPAGRRKSQHARGHSPREGERKESRLPQRVRPREGEDSCLNMPGELTRGKEKVSTCPGTQPTGRRRWWSLVTNNFA